MNEQKTHQKQMQLIGGVKVSDSNKRVLQVVDPNKISLQPPAISDSDFFKLFYPDNEWSFECLFEHYHLREGSIFESTNKYGALHKYKLVGVVDEANPVHLYDLNDTEHPDTFVSPQWFNYRTLNIIQY